MIINATTGNKIAKLLQKKVGQQIESRSIKEAGLSIFAPENARTYDFVSGIGKKGQFNIFSFKDADGNLIKRFTRYLKDDNKYTDIITNIEKNSDVINRTQQTINGSLRSSERICDQIDYSSLLRVNDQKFLRSNTTLSKKGDFGGWDVLRKGRSAKGIKFDYNYDGKPTNIEYKNTNGIKLDITEEESQYLPFLPQKFNISRQNGTSKLFDTDFSTYNVQNRIKLSQIIQERFQKIKEGILPKARGIRHNDMLIVRQNRELANTLRAKGTPYNAEAQGNGQIYLAIDIPNGTESRFVLSRMAHEMQHQAERIKSFCGGESALIDALKDLGIQSEKTTKEYVDYFIKSNKEIYDRCVAEYGLYKKGTPEYEEAVKLWKDRITNQHSYKSKEEHDAINWEARAVNRELEQISLLGQIKTKVRNFLQQL